MYLLYGGDYPPRRRYLGPSTSSQSSLAVNRLTPYDKHAHVGGLAGVNCD
jgi:hypothetical protein